MDPDGEAVTLALQLCGSSATTLRRLELTGKLMFQSLRVLQEISYDVKITQLMSLVESTLEINVKDPNVQEDSNSGSSTGDSSSSDEGSALPSVSLLATVSVALSVQH